MIDSKNTFLLYIRVIMQGVSVEKYVRKEPLPPIKDDALVELQNVSYSDDVIQERLQGINLVVKRGENVVFLGPEGSGKELILKLITGKIHPDQGVVMVNGQPIHKKNEIQLERYRKTIGYVSHNFGLLNNMSAIENILLPMRFHTNFSESKLREMADGYLEKYHLKAKQNKRPQLLSYSEKLRVAFVRTLIMKPEVVILDNAFGGQCPLAMSKLLELAQEDLLANNISLIMASYWPSFFIGFAHKYFLFYRGKIVFEGDRKTLQLTDNAYVRQYIDHPLEGPMTSFFSGYAD